MVAQRTRASRRASPFIWRARIGHRRRICRRSRAGEERIKRTQVIEVTPDKKVVWALRDWRNLGPATTVQLLDEPGIPQQPGDLQR